MNAGRASKKNVEAEWPSLAALVLDAEVAPASLLCQRSYALLDEATIGPDGTVSERRYAQNDAHPCHLLGALAHTWRAAPPGQRYAALVRAAPTQLRCPLSGLPLTDPMTTPDGNTYDRRAFPRQGPARLGEPPVHNAAVATLAGLLCGAGGDGHRAGGAAGEAALPAVRPSAAARACVVASRGASHPAAPLAALGRSSAAPLAAFGQSPAPAAAGPAPTAFGATRTAAPVPGAYTSVTPAPVVASTSAAASTSATSTPTAALPPPGRAAPAGAAASAPSAAAVPLRGTRLAHGGCVTAVAASPRFVASAGADGHVKVFAHDGVLLHDLDHAGDAISALAIFGGARLAAAGTRGRIYVWDLTSGSLEFHHDRHGKSAITALSAGGTLVFSGDADGRLLRYSVAHKKVTSSKQAHASAVTALNSFQGGWLVSSGGKQGKAKIWSPEGDCHGTCAGFPDRHRIEVLAFCSPYIFAGNAHGDIRRWDTDGHGPTTVRAGAGAPITGLAVVGDAVIAAQCEQVDLFAFQRRGRPDQQPQRLRGHTHPVTALTVDGGLMVSGSRDGTVFLWDVSHL